MFEEFESLFEEAVTLKPKEKKKEKKKKQKKSDVVKKELAYFRRKFYSLKDKDARREFVEKYLLELEQLYDPDIVETIREKIHEILKREKLFEEVKKKEVRKRKIKKTVKKLSRELIYKPNIRW